MRLRPVDLGKAVGLSPQAIRKYEQWGFIPPAERGENGYRIYGAQHLQAMRSVRVMRGGFEWRTTLRVMKALHAGDLGAAMAAVDAHFAGLHRERVLLMETLGALRIATALEQAAQPGRKKSKGPPGQRTLLYVGEVAERAGVEVSAVRHWEEQGLVEPLRDEQSGYRLYDEAQALRVQVIALLRRAGYDLKAIAPVIQELSAGRRETAVAAAEERLGRLAATSRRCVAATAALQEYLEELGL